MNTEATTLYKLMVLYMLSKVNFPLSNSQIADFMLDNRDIYTPLIRFILLRNGVRAFTAHCAKTDFRLPNRLSTCSHLP